MTDHDNTTTDDNAEASAVARRLFGRDPDDLAHNEQQTHQTSDTTTPEPRGIFAPGH